MSVLLEALKKAAEEKKKVSQEDVILEKAPQNEPVPAALVLKTNENSVSQEHQPSLESSDFQEIKAEGDPNALSSEPQKPFSIRLSPDAPSKTDHATSIEDLELESSSSSQTQDEMPSASKVGHTIHSEATESNAILQPPLPEKEQRSPNTESVEESYEWRFTTSPGYQASTELSKEDKKELIEEDELQKANPILGTSTRFFQGLKRTRFRYYFFGHSSNVAIYTLFSVLAISAVGFYGVYYLQQQQTALDRTMLKYKLVRTELPSTLTSTAALTDSPVSLTDTVAPPPILELTEPPQPEVSVGLDSDESEQANEAPSQKEPVKTQVNKAAKTQLKKVETSQPKSVFDESSRVVISQSIQESDIKKGYNALYKGQWDQAKQYFEETVKLDPTNIQALTGLAASYAQLGNEAKALAHYQTVLSIDSENLHALEAMVSLLGDQLVGADWQGEIANVLKVYPESAILNNAMGHFYAQDLDWQTAQSYYFNAHALDNQNANYLVNLAVSLDHLGQYALAENYYTQALVHSPEVTQNFDALQIKQRVVMLRQFIGTSDQ